MFEKSTIQDTFEQATSTSSSSVLNSPKESNQSQLGDDIRNYIDVRLDAPYAELRSQSQKIKQNSDIILGTVVFAVISFSIAVYTYSLDNIENKKPRVIYNVDVSLDEENSDSFIQLMREIDPTERLEIDSGSVSELEDNFNVDDFLLQQGIEKIY